MTTQLSGNIVEKKVLIVDDDDDVRLAFRTIITAAGFTVLDTASPLEALEILKREAIPVIFLDLEMPEMDGVELCRQIRKFRAMDCIYALTAYSSIYDVVRCREAGFDDYFLKPFDADTIIGITKNAFARLERWHQSLRR